MPTLRELDAQLLRVKFVDATEKDERGYFLRGEDGEPHIWSANTPRFTFFEPVETVAEAHGVRFLCPKSFAKNGGPKGTHSVYVFFQGSPHAGHNKQGQEVRWQVVGGTTIDDLQLTPSILEQDEDSPDPCCWHGFVGSSGVPPGHAQ